MYICIYICKDIQVCIYMYISHLCVNRCRRPGARRRQSSRRLRRSRVLTARAIGRCGLLGDQLCCRHRCYSGWDRLVVRNGFVVRHGLVIRNG